MRNKKKKMKYRQISAHQQRPVCVDHTDVSNDLGWYIGCESNSSLDTIHGSWCQCVVF